MRTMIVMLALAGVSTAAMAEATVCRGKGGAYLSECGTCPAGMLISGPNKANGKQCEADPTVPAGPVSRSDQDHSARQDHASSRPAPASASGYEGGQGGSAASSTSAQEREVLLLKERKPRRRWIRIE
jgi:hypothetical protein